MLGKPHEGDRSGGQNAGTLAVSRGHWHHNEDDVKRWAELFQSGITIVHIAERYGVDPETVSNQLHGRGFTITLSLHRTSVAEWREGTDQPYLIRAVNDTLAKVPRAGWKLLPMHLSSGGCDPSSWIQVPLSIQPYSDVLEVIAQTQPLAKTFERAALFGLTTPRVLETQSELFAYLLGVMVGDSGKHGGSQNRYASMNLDLQLTQKHLTNERLRIRDDVRELLWVRNGEEARQTTIGCSAPWQTTDSSLQMDIRKISTVRLDVLRWAGFALG